MYTHFTKQILTEKDVWRIVGLEVRIYGSGNFLFFVILEIRNSGIHFWLFYKKKFKQREIE